MKAGFLKIAALRGSDFDPLAARSSLSPPCEPVQAANLTLSLHRHTQAAMADVVRPCIRSIPVIPAHASILCLYIA